MQDLLRELDLFHGEATEGAAQVFARLPHPPGADPREFQLSGELVGPFCKHATTLTARYRLADAGPGPTLLARGLVREPSYWSPELPMLYRATIRLERRGETNAQCERPFGLRRLGPRGKDLYLEGRRWVLRGMASHSVVPHQDSLAEWRELGAVKVEDCLDEAHFRAASEEGVIFIPWFFRGPPTINEVRWCARFPSIAIVPLAPEHGSAATLFRDHAPNILRAALLHVPHDGFSWPAPLPKSVPDWAQLAIVHASLTRKQSHREAEAPLIARTAATLTMPVIAARSLSQPQSLPKARAAVDELQRDLAPHGDFAGYLV